MRLTRGATRRALKPPRGGVHVLRSTGTGRAEAERTLSILWDSAGPRVCGTRGEKGGQAGARKRVPAPREEGGTSECRVGACNFTNTRARTPLLAVEESLLLSLSHAPLDIFIFVSNTCGVSGSDASRRGPHRRNTRGPVPRMRAPRRASGPPSGRAEDAPLSSALLYSVSTFVLFVREENNFCYFCNDVVLRDMPRFSARCTRDDISLVLPSRSSTAWLKNEN